MGRLRVFLPLKTKMANSETISAWLLEKLGKGKELPDDVCSSSYFELGLIDSFGVIELIDELEEEFSVRFTEAHFQDRRFATVDGLVEIILEIQNGK
jgi:acyl carrier protein